MRKFVVLIPAAGLVLALTGVVTTAASAGAALAGAAGTTWKVHPIPALPQGRSGLLAGISCPAAGDCWAAGYEGNLRTDSALYALAEHWNGTAWKLQDIPGPTDQTTLSSVSYAPATDCEAVGGSASAAGADHPLAEHWKREPPVRRLLHRHPLPGRRRVHQRPDLQLAGRQQLTALGLPTGLARG